MSAENPNSQQAVVSENEIVQQRIEKIKFWEESGVNPYGERYSDRNAVADCRKKFEEEEGKEEPAEVAVKIAGRMMSRRKMGRTMFADLKDFSGRVQLFVNNKVLGETLFPLFQKVDIGDIIGVEGTLFRTKTGEISVRVKNFTLLSKIIQPLPEKHHGLTDVEQRYRQRYVDLIANDDSMKVFKQRIAIMREIRNYMERLGYHEVETPMLQLQAGGASARPFETYYNALSTDMVMRIAPELNLKRLLVGGFEKVFEMNRNFRNEGFSKKHNPEFTVLEAYEAFGDCRTMMDLVEGMVTNAAEKVIGSLKIEHKDGSTIDLTTPWRRIDYVELIKEHTSADWFELPTEDKAAKAKELGVFCEANWEDDEISHAVYDKYIEPLLIQPTFVTRVPVEHVPLAKKCTDDPSKVDVYELVINGQEMAPGYSELNDPFDQRQRFEDQIKMMEGTEEEKSANIDEDFLTALEYAMPPAGGMGIGIDRLVMLLTGAETIRDVILFPQLKPVVTN
jgi:lysyl-tRNA synthetase class 2